MKRTKGSWILETCDMWYLTLDVKCKDSVFTLNVNCIDKNYAQQNFSAAIAALGKGVEIGSKLINDLYNGNSLDDPVEIVKVHGVFRTRTMIEKILMKGMSYQEQIPHPAESERTPFSTKSGRIRRRGRSLRDRREPSGLEEGGILRIPGAITLEGV